MFVFQSHLSFFTLLGANVQNIFLNNAIFVKKNFIFFNKKIHSPIYLHITKTNSGIKKTFFFRKAQLFALARLKTLSFASCLLLQ